MTDVEFKALFEQRTVDTLMAELKAAMSAPLSWYPGPSAPPAAQAMSYPVVEYHPVDEWNAGGREPMTLRVLFADAWIEPYVTWAGDIAWRATADGRKAGLK